MDKLSYYRLLTVKAQLRRLAVICALAALVLALAFLYIWIPILFPLILGIFFVWAAWAASWIGGPLMIGWAILLLVQLPHSNWGIWRQLPFYIALSVFIASGLMFIGATVVGWLSGLNKRPVKQ